MEPDYFSYPDLPPFDHVAGLVNGQECQRIYRHMLLGGEPASGVLVTRADCFLARRLHPDAQQLCRCGCDAVLVVHLPLEPNVLSALADQFPPPEPLGPGEFYVAIVLPSRIDPPFSVRWRREAIVPVSRGHQA